MRALILTAVVLVAGVSMSDKADAADRSPNHPAVSHGSGHGATVTLAAHHGHSPYGYSHLGPPRHHSYRPYGYHHGHGCYPPVIVRPPVVVPYGYYPYGYHAGYGYYHGGVSVNTGRVGFSVAF